jgi:hypothetical protein
MKTRMKAFENLKELNDFIDSNILTTRFHSFKDWIKIYKEQSTN